MMFSESKSYIKHTYYQGDMCMYTLEAGVVWKVWEDSVYMYVCLYTTIKAETTILKYDILLKMKTVSNIYFILIAKIIKLKTGFQTHW